VQCFAWPVPSDADALILYRVPQSIVPAGEGVGRAAARIWLRVRVIDLGECRLPRRHVLGVGRAITRDGGLCYTFLIFLVRVCLFLTVVRFCASASSFLA
jgi:hypothetical protein